MLINLLMLFWFAISVGVIVWVPRNLKRATSPGQFMLGVIVFLAAMSMLFGLTLRVLGDFNV